MNDYGYIDIGLVYFSYFDPWIMLIQLRKLLHKLLLPFSIYQDVSKDSPTFLLLLFCIHQFLLISDIFWHEIRNIFVT